MRVNRRSFLKTGVALPVLPMLLSGQVGISPIGLQLYTVRSELEKDFERTIAKVASVGYKEVEFAGYYGHSPAEVSGILKAHRLSGVSAHFSYASLNDTWPKIVEAAQIIGLRYLVIVTIDAGLRTQPGIWQRASELLNRAGEVSRSADIQLAYHNHLFEFAHEGTAKRPYEILLESTDLALVSMEMDLCWITAAREDPVDYFRRYPGRFPLVHVKDLTKLPPPQSQIGAVASREAVLPDLADVGQGIIDWPSLLSRSRAAGVKHFIIEHDVPRVPFDSITRSFRYVSKLRFDDTAV